MSSDTYNTRQPIELRRPRGGWGEPVQLLAPQRQPPVIIPPVGRAQDHVHSQNPIRAPITRKPERVEAAENEFRLTALALTMRAALWLVRKASKEIVIASMPLTILSVVVPASTTGDLAHLVDTLGVHRGQMSASEVITQDSLPYTKASDSILLVATGLDKTVPEDAAALYATLHQWPGIQDPKLNVSHMRGAEFGRFYDLHALDRLTRAERERLPDFIRAVNADIAANNSSLTGHESKVVVAFLSQLDLLPKNTKAHYAAVFNRPHQASSETYSFFMRMLTQAKHGKVIKARLEAYKKDVRTANEHYYATKGSFARAQESGLLNIMKLAGDITDTPVVDLLIVTDRETSIVAKSMQGYGKQSGKSARGPEQITTAMMQSLVAEYGLRLHGMILDYQISHHHLPKAERRLLEKTRAQLEGHASPDEYKDNYLLALAINHLSLEHDRVGFVKNVVNKGSSQGLSAERVEVTIPRAEQLALINFVGLGAASNMAYAYIENPNQPIVDNLTPKALSDNHLKGSMTIAEFFEIHIKPCGDRYTGFQLHVASNGELPVVPQAGVPSLAPGKHLRS